MTTAEFRKFESSRAIEFEKRFVSSQLKLSRSSGNIVTSFEHERFESNVFVKVIAFGEA